MRARKPTPVKKLTPTGKLKQQINELEADRAFKLDHITRLVKENSGLRETLAKRDADRQLEARTRLAGNLGQLMQAIAHAIQYTVAKESI